LAQANGSAADFNRNGWSVRRFFAGPDEAAEQEALNEKGLAVIRRVQDKLTGRDFAPYQTTHQWSGHGLASESVGVAEQVDMLIAQATSNERLCQCFIGWCPFW
jgi:FKBP12-rapamycin complex-associated protein